MFCVVYTRAAGKQFTYDIEAMQDGSYLIRLNDVVMRGGLPDPRRSGSNRWTTNYADAGIERAKEDIEWLVGMLEEPMPRTTAPVRRVRVPRTKPTPLVPEND